MNIPSLFRILTVLMSVPACRPADSDRSAETAELQAAHSSPAQAVVGKTQATELPTEVRAFLDMLAYAEGTDEHYNMNYGGSFFSDFSRHPRVWRASPWGTANVGSDAAGRYQFKSASWDEASSKRHLSDFSPANQDRAAVYLIERNGIGTFENVKNARVQSRFKAALTALSKVWASLPPQRYRGQKVKSESELWSVFQKAIKAY